MKIKHVIILLSSLLCIGCQSEKKQSLEIKDDIKDDTVRIATLEIDTTLYTGNDPNVHSTPILENAEKYFRTNNRYKSWDSNDSKVVMIRGVSELDSTITNIRVIRSSNIDSLDNEAIRLIKEARITPATDQQGNNIRFDFNIAILYPPKK